MPQLRRMNTVRIQRLWRKILDEKKRTTPYTGANEGQQRTGRIPHIARYGKRFLETFPTHRVRDGKYRVQIGPSTYESEVAIWLSGRSGKRMHPVGRIKIGFEKNTVILETIQGAGLGANPSRETKKELGTRWDDYLLSTIEAHARKSGYHTIKIRHFSDMYWYRNPMHDVEIPAQAEEIRTRMRALYTGIARRHGYRRNGAFWIKAI